VEQVRTFTCQHISRYSQHRFYPGYIGASVLQKLLRHPLASESTFTVLVRSEDKAQKFEKLVTMGNLGDIKVLHGSNSDLDILEAQSAKSDVVFSMVCTVRPSTDPSKR